MSLQVILPDPTSFLPAFSWDIVTSESHDHTNEVTEYPVETGVDISDHVRIKPDTVTIVGEITMTPIIATGGGFEGPMVLNVPTFTPPPFSSEAAAIGAAASAVKDLLFGPPPPTVVDLLQFPIPIDPITDAHNALLAIQTGRVFCQVVTASHTYANMVITAIGVKRDENSGVAEFTVTFKSVTTVTSATVSAPKPLIPAGAPKVSAGAQTPPPAPDAPKNTVLLNLGTAVANLIH